MSKLDDLLANYTADLEKIDEKVNAELLKAVAKSQGPSIYQKDASLVALSDPKEVARIKTNFLIKKLGLKDTPKLDDGIGAVKDKYPKRSKYRIVFYYLLVKHFKKASAFQS